MLCLNTLNVYAEEITDKPIKRGNSLVCKNGFINAKDLNHGELEKFIFNPNILIGGNLIKVPKVNKRIEKVDESSDEVWFRTNDGDIFQPEHEKYSSNSSPIFYIYKLKGSVEEIKKNFFQKYDTIIDGLMTKEHNELKSNAIAASEKFEAKIVGNILENKYTINSKINDIKYIKLDTSYGVTYNFCAMNSENYCYKTLPGYRESEIIRYQCTADGLNVYNSFISSRNKKNKYGEEINEIFLFFGKSKVKLKTE